MRVTKEPWCKVRTIFTRNSILLVKISFSSLIIFVSYPGDSIIGKTIDFGPIDLKLQCIAYSQDQFKCHLAST